MFKYIYIYTYARATGTIVVCTACVYTVWDSGVQLKSDILIIVCRGNVNPGEMGEGEGKELE